MTDSAIQTDNLLGGAPPIVGGVPPIVVRTKPTWLQTVCSIVIFVFCVAIVTGALLALKYAFNAPVVNTDHAALAFFKSSDFNKNVIDSISNDVTFRNKSMLWDALIVGFALFVSLGGFLYFMFEKLEKGVDDKLQAQTQAIQAVGKSVDDKIQAAGKSVDDKIQALSQSFYSLSSELHSYMRWMIGYISQGGRQHMSFDFESGFGNQPEQNFSKSMPSTSGETMKKFADKNSVQSQPQRDLTKPSTSGQVMEKCIEKNSVHSKPQQDFTKTSTSAEAMEDCVKKNSVESKSEGADRHVRYSKGAEEINLDSS